MVRIQHIMLDCIVFVKVMRVGVGFLKFLMMSTNTIGVNIGGVKIVSGIAIQGGYDIYGNYAWVLKSVAEPAPEF